MAKHVEHEMSLDQEMEALYQQLLDREVEEPPLWSRRARSLRKWKKNNAETAERMERITRARQGVPSVAFEENYGAVTRHGFRGLGSGYARAAAELREYQTATSLAAGWTPNVVGAPAPMIGAPLGRHAVTGVDVAFDALSWFKEGIISNPSLFVMSLPGLGKSTFVRKILMSHVAQGHVPIVAGDVKAEYIGFAEQVGGQIITVGPGKGQINPLDAGALGGIVPELEANRQFLADRGEEDLINEVKTKVHHRQMTMVASLISLGRTAPIQDFETMLVSQALTELYSSDFTWDNPPILPDLVHQLEHPTEAMMAKARARDLDEWAMRCDSLILSLNALLNGATGEIFSGHTTSPISVDSTAVVMDVSAVDRGDSSMKAAVILSAWSAAFGAVEAAHTLADCGLRPQKYFALTLDEMWQTLGAAPGIVERVDEISRLNRTDGLALYEITHTSNDLNALADERDRVKARGFIERAGAVACGGLPVEELNLLENTLRFSPEEGHRIVSWSRGATPKRSRTGGKVAVPPGRGCFMIKPSKDGSPGVPIQTILTPTEVIEELHNTNKRFEQLNVRTTDDAVL